MILKLDKDELATLKVVLEPELNGRRVGSIGQRRDEHGMPFVVKVEAIEEGRGLFE